MTGCMRAGVLLERRASGLNEADRLVLEDHLQGCSRCREQAAWLDAVRETLDAPLPTRPGRIERAVQVAIDRGMRPASKHPEAHRRMPMVLAVAVALTLCVGVLLAWPEEDVQATAMAALDFDALRVRRVLEGSLRVGDQAVGVDGPFRTDQTMTTQGGAKLAFEDGTVELGGDTVAKWNAGTSDLSLIEGSVRVAVAPAAGRVFRVTTPRFSVEVVGTRFRVTLTGVVVERGTVRVRVLGEEPVLVRTGERWKLPEADSAGAVTVASRRSRPSASVLLDRARHAVAHGQVEAARRDIGAALRSNPTTHQVAEAQTLLAECALVSGDSEGAAKGYEDVAARHAGSAAGENALFAAARLAATQGDRPEAVRLFRRYLAEYPNGKFKNEARARLAVLQSRE